MKVYERQPYSGKLVFAAFSGSHQDAIAKGMKYREEKGIDVWTVPYLPIDPGDVGRKYEADVIRINSQSGKGGIGYILETQFKLVLPPKFRESFGYQVKSISDHQHKELLKDEVYQIFIDDFVNKTDNLQLVNANYDTTEKTVKATISLQFNGEVTTVDVTGNGRLDCLNNAIKKITKIDYSLDNYVSHAIDGKSDAHAAAYVSLSNGGKIYWGAGIHSDISSSSICALISAFNIMISSNK